MGCGSAGCERAGVGGLPEEDCKVQSGPQLSLVAWYPHTCSVTALAAATPCVLR